eukprot:SAG25_NODE_9546_length_368_cov_0.918216_1_plen_102_part_10
MEAATAAAAANRQDRLARQAGEAAATAAAAPTAAGVTTLNDTEALLISLRREVESHPKIICQPAHRNLHDKIEHALANGDISKEQAAEMHLRREAGNRAAHP